MDQVGLLLGLSPECSTALFVNFDLSKGINRYKMEIINTLSSKQTASA